MIDDFRSFQIEITNEDYKNIVYFNTFKKEKRMFFIFACVLISIFLILISIRKGTIDSYLTFGASVGVVILFFVQILLTHMKIKRFLKTKPNMLNVKRKITVCPEHIIQSALEGGDDILYDYKAIQIAYELRSYFLIFTKTGKTLIIPKRYIEEDIVEYIRGVLKGNLGNDFELRKRS